MKDLKKDYIMLYDGHINDIPRLSDEEEQDFFDYYNDGIEGSYSDLHNQYLHKKEIRNLNKGKNYK